MNNKERNINEDKPKIYIYKAKTDLESTMESFQKNAKSPYMRKLGLHFADKIRSASPGISTDSNSKSLKQIKISPEQYVINTQQSLTHSEKSESSDIIKNFIKEEEEQNQDKLTLQLWKIQDTPANLADTFSSTNFLMNSHLTDRLQEKFKVLKNVGKKNTRKLRTPRNLISTVINADFSNRNRGNIEDIGFDIPAYSYVESSRISASISSQGDIHVEDQFQKNKQQNLKVNIDPFDNCFDEEEEEDLSSPDSQKVKNTLQKLFLNRMVNVSEFQVEFHFETFLKFMMYHLMFFYFGSISCIPVLIFDSKHVMNNMSFWVTTKNRTSFIVQTLQWISCMIIIGSWIQKFHEIVPLVDVKLDYIYFEQLYFFNILVLIRSFVIAVRYGYSSSFRLDSLKKANQEFGFIAQDLLLPNWINFNPDGLDLEIEGAMWRNQVEVGTFKFTFIEEINSKMSERLLDNNYYNRDGNQKFDMKNYQKELDSFKKSIQGKRSSLNKLDIYNNDYDVFGLHSQKNISIKNLRDKKYDGNLVLREIGLFAGAHQRSTSLFLLVAVLGKISLPFIARYYQFGVVALDWDSSIYTVFDTLASAMFLFQNYLFVIAGYVDFQRRYLMMKSVGALLNPFKDNYDVKYQIFPTINLASKESIFTWFQLRQCVMDFGKKYMMRIFMYSSVFLGMYLFLMAALILSFFGIIDFQFSMYFNLCCIYDIVFVLSIIMSMFYFGAIVNEQFVDNKLQLVKIKQTLLYVKFNLLRILNPKTKYTGAYLKIFQKICRQVHQDRIAEYKKRGKKFTSQEVITSLKIQIDELVEQIESIIQRLEVENEHRPLKLLGLKATFGLMNQIYTTLLTVMAAVAQRFFSNSNGESSGIF